jgi:hypothetical protein
VRSIVGAGPGCVLVVTLTVAAPAPNFVGQVLPHSEQNDTDELPSNG